ncbi:MAG TPA: response regulator transcription factor, partial [Candidatus Angelobacter sp.]|nr:response regulator transcription factor [Candidatus Angelobacter sp.]
MKGAPTTRNNSSPQPLAGKGTINPVNQLLIIDDDRALVNLLKRFLEAEGFHVDAAYDHDSGLAAARANQHELVILDVMLPGGSGFELLKALRHESSAVPVLLLTARGEAVDRILGLEIGADDYLAKPFDPRELVARIRAVLRRTRETASGAERGDQDEVLQIGDIELSLGTRNVTCGAKPVDLTSVEFNVLELLLRNAGSVVTREQIAEVALGRPLNAFDRSVDVHVSRLRKKLGIFPGTQDLIRPIRGVGYF